MRYIEIVWFTEWERIKLQNKYIYKKIWVKRKAVRCLGSKYKFKQQKEMYEAGWSKGKDNFFK